jgi:hypothetical protein
MLCISFNGALFICMKSLFSPYTYIFLISKESSMVNVLKLTLTVCLALQI